MSENVSAFFDIIADSSVFTDAFVQARDASLKFAADFKATATSVESDAQRMQLAMVRSLSGTGGALAATSPEFRAQAAAALNARLAAYGAPGMGGAVAGAEAGAAAGGGLSFNNLLGAAAIITSILAPLGLLADGLLRGAESYASMSAEVLRNSEAIGINAQDLQAWQKVAEIAGIDQQSMVLDFERFAKNLAEGAPSLKLAGVTLQQLGITSTDVGKSILQLSDYFHTHSDQAEKAAIAQALFGRSGAELIPILDQGSQAFKNYETELEKMGVILSNSDLIIGAQAQSAIQGFSEAFDGAKNRLLAAALPGFTTFFNELSTLLVNNGQLWSDIGQMVSDTVSLILGLIAGITGQKIDLSSNAGSAASAYEGLGGAANDAASGINNATQAGKAATDALNDQISVLEAQKQAYDDSAEAQKQALNDQLDTLRDVNDSRRRSGEDIVTYERRLEELGIQDKINAIDDAKSTYDRTTQAHIDALRREVQAVSEASGTMANDLSAGMSTAGLNMQGIVDKTSSSISKKFVDLGTNVGQTIKLWLSDPQGAISEAANQFGQTLGHSMWEGMIHSFPLLGGADIIGEQAWAALPAALQTIVKDLQPHALGYVTHGPEVALIGEGGDEAVLPLNNPGRSLALMEQSGLADLARTTGGAAASAASAMIVQFHGPVADELVASRVVARIDKAMRQRGFTAAHGFGST